MIYGTKVGDDMLSRSRPSLWDNPMWDAVDVKAGGVMPGEAQLLYGLVRALQPDVVLEVGTSHGYSTLHLAAGCRDNGRGKVFTVETDNGRRASAHNNAAAAGFNVPDIVGGDIEFHPAIPPLKKIDLLFLDAGHEAADVLSYIEQTRTGIHDQTVIIIHDAHFMNHAREAARAIGWPFVLLNTTSIMGMAILSRGEQ